MAKEYLWHAVIGGTEHQIRCVISNNRFIIYDNEEYVTAVYRKLFQNLRGGVIENVTIAGKPCRFVVWDAQPDLEVDGKLLRAGCSFEEGFRSYRNTLKVMAIVYFCFAAVWTVLSLIHPARPRGLNFAAMLVLIGIVQLRAWIKLNNIEG